MEDQALTNEEFNYIFLSLQGFIVKEKKYNYTKKIIKNNVFYTFDF